MGGEEVYSSYSFLTSALHGGWVVIVTPRPRFTPGERTPCTHWIGGWVGPRAGLDAGARRKISSCRGSNLDHPIVQPVIRHYTGWATASRSLYMVVSFRPVIVGPLNKCIKSCIIQTISMSNEGSVRPPC
jgi:hypothetical protein